VKWRWKLNLWGVGGVSPPFYLHYIYPFLLLLILLSYIIIIYYHCSAGTAEPSIHIYYYYYSGGLGGFSPHFIGIIYNYFSLYITIVQPARLNLRFTYSIITIIFSFDSHTVLLLLFFLLYSNVRLYKTIKCWC
jgi:hypothetical protein